MKKILYSALLLVLILVLGCTQTPKSEKPLIKAVYLVSGNEGELRKEDLAAHPGVLVVHSGDELKAAIDKMRAAIWVDKNAINLIEPEWFDKMPQKSYVVTQSNASRIYCIRGSLYVWEQKKEETCQCCI